MDAAGRVEPALAQPGTRGIDRLPPNAQDLGLDLIDLGVRQGRPRAPEDSRAGLDNLDHVDRRTHGPLDACNEVDSDPGRRRSVGCEQHTHRINPLAGAAPGPFSVR